MTPTITDLAHRIHKNYEQRAQLRHVFYTRTSWNNLDQASRDEFINIARAITNGESEYNGTPIPQWVTDLKEHA